jgi:anti-sigma factor RsiW
MTEAMFMPCDDWSEKLTMPKDDLAVSDRAALVAHIASCPTCSLASIDDDMIGRLIRALPAPDFPAGLPPRLLQLMEGKDEDREYQESDPSIVAQSSPQEALTQVPQGVQEQQIRDDERSIPKYRRAQTHSRRGLKGM